MADEFDELFGIGGEEEPTHVTGYRSWGLKFVGPGEPRLTPKTMGSSGTHSAWDPGDEGEVLSDYDPEAHGPFEKSMHGLYSKKTLKDLRLESGYAERGDIIGAITPYGDIIHGDQGFRSTKAKIQAFYKGTAMCSVCGLPAKHVVRSNGDAALLCRACRGRLIKLIDRLGPQGEEYTLEEVLEKLAERYDTSVSDFPEEGWV